MKKFIPPEGAMQFEVDRCRIATAAPAIVTRMWIEPYDGIPSSPKMDGCKCKQFYLVIHVQNRPEFSNRNRRCLVVFWSKGITA